MEQPSGSEYPNISKEKNGSPEKPMVLRGGTTKDITEIAWSNSRQERSKYFFSFGREIFSINPDGKIDYADETNEKMDEKGEDLNRIKDGFIEYLIERSYGK